MAKQQVKVTIGAPAEVAFEVLVEDRLDYSGNTEILFREPLGDRAMGPGYGYKSIYLHRGHRCESRTRIVTFESPRLIEEETFHRCEMAKKNVEITNRLELIPYGAGCTLLMTKETKLPGRLSLRRWLRGSDDARLLAKADFFASKVEARHRSRLTAVS